VIDDTGAQGSRQDTKRRELLGLLVRLTISTELLNLLKDAKQDRRGSAAELSEQDLKRAVQAALYANAQFEFGNTTLDLGDTSADWDLIREVAADYCDRVIVGVDAWEADDQQKWKAVCNEVTDLMSSVI
jgi:hypothetical protein